MPGMYNQQRISTYTFPGVYARTLHTKMKTKIKTEYHRVYVCLTVHVLYMYTYCICIRVLHGVRVNSRLHNLHTAVKSIYGYVTYCYPTQVYYIRTSGGMHTPYWCMCTIMGCTPFRSKFCNVLPAQIIKCKTTDSKRALYPKLYY